jgi:DNA transformation protein and related proteins
MSSDFIDYVTELLTPLGSVRSKRMFGGIGIYIDGLFCAIIADDALYLKADDINEAEFQAAGCEQITYEKQGEIFAMRYYRVPEEAMDNSHEMMRWAKLGMAAALRKATDPKSKKKKSSG